MELRVPLLDKLVEHTLVGEIRNRFSDGLFALVSMVRSLLKWPADRRKILTTLLTKVPITPTTVQSILSIELKASKATSGLSTAGSWTLILTVTFLDFGRSRPSRSSALGTIASLLRRINRHGNGRFGEGSFPCRTKGCSTIGDGILG